MRVRGISAFVFLLLVYVCCYTASAALRQASTIDDSASSARARQTSKILTDDVIYDRYEVDYTLKSRTAPSDVLLPFSRSAVSEGSTVVTTGLEVQSTSIGIITTVAGTGVSGYSGDGRPATSAMLSNPFGVAVDSSDNIVIGDTSNHRIRMVTKSTGIITTVAGTGWGGYSGDGGPSTSAMLYYPSNFAVDVSGNIVIADYYNHRIRLVTKSTGIISSVAGTGLQGYSGDGGPATSAMLYNPVSVAVDSSGIIVIADYNNHRIRMVTKSTGIITTVAGTGVYGYSGDGGLATSAMLNYPLSVAVDSSANIVIADYYNNRIRMFAQHTSPSILPSSSLTPMPTISPSLPPTVSPSAIVTPTAAPTSPSVFPSAAPSLLPATSPSTLPSFSPSILPPPPSLMHTASPAVISLSLSVSPTPPPCPPCPLLLHLSHPLLLRLSYPLLLHLYCRLLHLYCPLLRRLSCQPLLSRHRPQQHRLCRSFTPLRLSLV